MVLTGETEVLGENLPRRNFVHHKSHLPDQGENPGRRGGKPATNRFSYGAARLIEINTKNFPGGKGRPERKVDNLITTYEPIV
jgi:hypothetical protein